MFNFLIAIIYLAFISLGLPDAVFGIVANHITVALLPFYLLVIFVMMAIMYQRLVKKA